VKDIKRKSLDVQGHVKNDRFLCTASQLIARARRRTVWEYDFELRAISRVVDEGQSATLFDFDDGVVGTKVIQRAAILRPDVNFNIRVFTCADGCHFFLSLILLKLN
jgi:hypothetical protein